VVAAAIASQDDRTGEKAREVVTESGALAVVKWRSSTLTGSWPTSATIVG